MSFLSPAQLKQYKDKGYVSPIDALSKDEALEIREEIELIEKKWPKELDGLGRNYIHLISPIFDKVSHNPKILDAVESIIRRDILICGTTLFIKNPNEKGFVSFHQDAKYIGLEPHNWVTAWVAITDSYEENGCMRLWPKSHLEIRDHNEKFNKGNLLTRGQTIEEVPVSELKSVELKAGQMSLHHPRIVHGSGINNSNDRRIGFVIQSYIGTNVKQILGKNSVQVARGTDHYNYHLKINRPISLMDQNDIKIKKAENDNLHNIFYMGSEKKGSY